VKESNGMDHTQEEKGFVFPLEFPLKIFGYNHPEFIEVVEITIAEHVPKSDWALTKSNISKNGKYISYTVVVIAQDREQLHAVCKAVKYCPVALMSI
jgi:putative lipoic acid-binding regulatory protein